jgi:hypothetical protein
MGEDVLSVAVGYPFAIDGLVAGYEDSRFAAIMVGDGQDGVISLRHRQIGDKVQCDSPKGYVRLPRGNWY